jgi:DNA-binding CsgD family transcriptional regulator
MHEKEVALTVEMKRDRLARLRPRERDCLRLVAQGYLAKEIAAMLGISASRVNKHILASRRMLGARTRGEAGRIFALWEAESAPDQGGQPMGAHLMTLAKAEEIASSDPVETDAKGSSESDGALAERQQPYSPAPDAPVILDLLPFRLGGRQFNDLSTAHTLILIAVFAIVAVIAVGSAISLLSGLDSLLSS